MVIGLKICGSATNSLASSPAGRARCFWDSSGELRKQNDAQCRGTNPPPPATWSSSAFSWSLPIRVAFAKLRSASYLPSVAGFRSDRFSVQVTSILRPARTGAIWAYRSAGWCNPRSPRKRNERGFESGGPAAGAVAASAVKRKKTSAARQVHRLICGFSRSVVGLRSRIELGYMNPCAQNRRGTGLTRLRALSI